MISAIGTGYLSPFIERKQPVPFVSPLPAALKNLVPPPAAVLGRRWFVKGEPSRAAEAILAGLVEHRADTLHDLLACPLPLLPRADFLDRRIAEPLQESVTISGPEAIQRLIDERGVELRQLGIKNQTLAALHGVEVGGAAAAGPYCPREVRTNAATVSQRIIRGTISVRATGRRTVPVGTSGRP